MDASTSSLQSKTLRHTDVPERYQLYRAALEWDLIDPIVIEKKEDIKSEKYWKDKVNPYNHQVSNLITFCRRLPVTLLADDVGLGKTISAGLVISELISRGRLSKILIVCPKILREQWKEELDTKFGISAVIATGKELIKAEPPSGVGAVITTYRSATLYLESIKDSGFDMLILDEAHKLRNLHGTDKSPQVALQFKEVLKERQFKYVLMLTATPIHNRLWDLYSLVDLLSVARGHENPFGEPGMFARRFIADKSSEARNLKLEMQEEFRDIVYGYMSRVRRDDAGLHFPQREVQLHMVQPTDSELRLFGVVGESIQGLNRLTQISILQALVSSPEALDKQLAVMARNETVPKSLAKEVNEVVKEIKHTAKLNGLGALIDKLRAEQPKDWRVVVFTTRRETQTTIQDFLNKRGIKAGLINGNSGATNQEMLGDFKAAKPKIHVIISTEAGSEGVNMQAANVLVNYDLPWNPMIVEQRIGRIQRLGSKYDKVCIFNIVLKGTFEEYIVGRLMEKLQMASHAIGDIESLLQASGMGEGEDEGSAESFEDKILKLVLASLAGKNVEEATEKEEKSIYQAKLQLETREREIDSMLGDMESSRADSGPKSPQLPPVINSINSKDFALAALKGLGAVIKKDKDGLYECEFEDKKELIRFESEPVEGTISTLYAPGTNAFDKLVRKITLSELHRVQDSDESILAKAEDIIVSWVKAFGGTFIKSTITGIDKCFSGTALVRVRATVAHDSYERLVEVLCTPEEHQIDVGKSNISEIGKVIDKPESVGVDPDLLIENSKLDAGIAEFCRFYKERLSFELSSVGEDARKVKKIEDDFTPRLSHTLVGLEGFVARDLEIDVDFSFDSEFKYSSHIRITPSTGEIWSAPEMAECEFSHMSVPKTCLNKCDISGLKVLEHLLVTSEISNRKALPEYIVECGVTGKRVLSDEVEKSDISEKLIITSLLKTSAISGKRAEPEFFTKCEFTGSEILESESAVSQISGKKYRSDEELISAVSGKKGHKTEFIYCAETKQPLAPSEAETCDVTKKQVMPGILETCEMSGKRVIPSRLEKSAISGKKALKKFFVTSSLSPARFLEEEGIKSAVGNFCIPLETQACVWSGKSYHPDDLRKCDLTGINVHFEFVTTVEPIRLKVLMSLLDGVNRRTDKVDLNEKISESLAKATGNKNPKIEFTELSPDKKLLAFSGEVRTFLGLKLRYVGGLFSIEENMILGKLSLGRRENGAWVED
jgi:superfamily II DNA or RNA helicase